MHEPGDPPPPPTGRGPARWGRPVPIAHGERAVGWALRASAALLVLLGVALVGLLAHGAWSWASGAAPLPGSLWPRVVGTLVVTGLATALAVPVGLAAALFLAELADPRLRRWLKPAFELLASLPTLAFAWVVVVMVPGLALPSAVGAALVLALMIAPTVASLCDDALRAVPRDLRAAALALGASRLRMLRVVVMPAAAPGLVSAAMIAVARAVGETMLVTLAVGRVPEVGLDPRVAVAPLVAPGRTDAVVGVPVLLCVLMVLGAWAMHLRRHHERRRDG